MARAATMLLIVACFAVLATAVYAGSECSGVKRYKFQFFEQEGKDKLIFSPSKPQNGKIGNGYVYDNRATKNHNSNSELYGYVGGMYYYTSGTTTQEVLTIYFEDINEKGGTFAKAEIHLRGVWNLDSDGEDLPTQELSIVGGQGGLSGASGTVIFTKVGDDVWLIQGLIFVDEAQCKIPTNAHIAQVIGA